MVEPAVCVPKAKDVIREATAAAEPDDEVPGDNLKLYGSTYGELISDKIKTNNLLVFSDFNSEIKKTKEMNTILKKFEISNSIMILDKTSKDKVEKSIRNIPNIKVTDINHFSAFDIVKFKKVVFTESSIKELEKKYN